MTGRQNSVSADGSQVPVLTQTLESDCAWRSPSLADADWLVPLSGRAMDELDVLALKLDTYDEAIESLRAEDFNLGAAAEVMEAVNQKLYQGVGFAVLDRLPVDRWGMKSSKAISWLLTSMLGSVVPQKIDGTRLYEVMDKGLKLGYGVRRSITSLEQDFHTDGGWLAQAPEIVTLACLRPANAGGFSRVTSLATAHNEMRERHPELLERLYRPFWWDRQAEHPQGEARSSQHPVFTWGDGKLTSRYYSDYIRKGFELAGETLDSEGEAALAAMKAIVDMPENWFEFRLEQGQIEFVNNYLQAHSRTAFEDDNSRGGRYLLRLWSRRSGGIALESSTETIE